MSNGGPPPVREYFYQRPGRGVSDPARDGLLSPLTRYWRDRGGPGPVDARSQLDEAGDATVPSTTDRRP